MGDEIKRYQAAADDAAAYPYMEEVKDGDCPEEEMFVRLADHKLVANALIELRDKARKCAESLQDGETPDKADILRLIQAIEGADQALPPLGLETTLRSAEDLGALEDNDMPREHQPTPEGGTR